MADSAKAAQRAEFRKLAFHVLTTVLDTENDPDKGFVAEDLEPDAAWVERTLDSYAPLLNLQGVEDELAPMAVSLHAAAARGGAGSIASMANYNRVRRALSLLRGEVKSI